MEERAKVPTEECKCTWAKDEVRGDWVLVERDSHCTMH